jgi:mannose-1-phosphate guanylyltransferase
MIYNVILSGGVGSRLWPLSRKSKPKQYLPLFNNQSLFELNLLRNQNLVDANFIVGNKDNYVLSEEILKKATHKPFKQLVEAAPKNTAAAIAFACFDLNAEDVLLITPADHIIEGQDRYEKVINRGIELAKSGFLVTFGIKPTKPETGYGYIETAGQEVLSFHEKPNLSKAISFLTNEAFLWNSGMFCFKAETYLKELKQLEPFLYEKALNAWLAKKGMFLQSLETKLIPSISVDYAVMERSANLKVVAADFTWSDLGSFDAIWEYDDITQPHQKKNNFYLSSTVEKHIEFLNIENILVVETQDAILVMPRNESQNVKKIYERLEKEDSKLIE